MIIHDVIQGSDEWKAVRAGLFTPSNMHKLFMKQNTKGYQEYILQIARERVTKKPVESFKSECMQRGNNLESEAIEQYEKDTFQKVQRLGFMQVDDWTGMSPDGLIGNDGLIQVKAVKWNTFGAIQTVDDVEKDYIIQCQAELLISDRKWNDLYFYDPELEPKTFRILPDTEMQDKILDEIEIAKEKVIELMQTIKLRS